MHVDEEVLKQYVNDALECLKVKFVNNVDDISTAEPKHKVEFAYQQFGEGETIFGYKNLQLTLCYTEATMFPHLIIEHSGKIENSKQEPDDIYKLMEVEIVKDQKDSFENREIFMEKVKEQIKFEPFGAELPTFIHDKENGKKFALFRLDGELTEKEKLYVEHIQSILFYYIEKVEYTDSDDERFMYFMLYEVFENQAKSGRQYRIAGYASYYKYYCHPNMWRLRAAHTFIFPNFRGMGLGAKLLHAVNMDIKKHDDIYDTTLETPAVELTQARDAASVLELIEMEEFSKEKILEPFTKEKAEAARKAWKMYKVAAQRAYEILKYAIVKKKGKDAVAEFRDEVLKRIRKPYDKKDKIYQRMVNSLDPEETEVVVSHEAETMSETQLNQFTDATLESYQLIINRLQKHSDVFCKFL
uniref:Histone acetyltransferase type B catalytic subunit n=1 Tax=Panagrolaimus sp. PS1159 TaxID=55785 RepID=A0AC35GUC8_9BILA